MGTRGWGLGALDRALLLQQNTFSAEAICERNPPDFVWREAPLPHSRVRKSLCVNDSVRALRTDKRMTERCLDMHKGNMLQTGAVASGLSKTKRRKRTVKIAACPYRADEYSSFVEGAVSSLRDIEDLAHLGRGWGFALTTDQEGQCHWQMSLPCRTPTSCTRRLALLWDLI